MSCAHSGFSSLLQLGIEGCGGLCVFLRRAAFLCLVGFMRTSSKAQLRYTRMPMAARRSLPNMTYFFLTRLWHRFIEVAGCKCLWEKGLWPACCWEQLHGLSNLLYWLIQGTGRLLAGTKLHEVVCRAPFAGSALAFGTTCTSLSGC